jgi:hypothetical protein
MGDDEELKVQGGGGDGYHKLGRGLYHVDGLAIAVSL